jgi:antirestriction protein ArdC
MAKQTANEIYADITATILEALETGTAPWVKPWRDVPQIGGNLPHNALSGRAYRGINVPLGWMVAQNKGYQSQGWVSYNQAKALGGNVRKGEKSHFGVVFFRKLTITETNAAGEKVTKGIPLIRTTPVFNIEQCENITLPKRRPVELRDTTADLTAREIAERIGMGLQVGGNVACYVPSIDRVMMPTAAQFNDDASALSTFFHEAGHWTGHKSRLDRDLTGRFGSAAYAAEELVAELTSAFLCAANNVNGQLQHPEYIGNWIKVLKDDHKAFLKASSLAQAAADFITGQEAEAEAEEEAAA